MMSLLRHVHVVQASNRLNFSSSLINVSSYHICSLQLHYTVMYRVSGQSWGTINYTSERRMHTFPKVGGTFDHLSFKFDVVFC